MFCHCGVLYVYKAVSVPSLGQLALLEDAIPCKKTKWGPAC